MPMRLAYAKVLRFAGHDLLAERLLGTLVESYIQTDNLGHWPSIRGLHVLPLCQLPFGGVICLDARIAEALLLSESQNLRLLIKKGLNEFRYRRGVLKGAGYALPNGVVIVYDEKSLEE